MITGVRVIASQVQVQISLACNAKQTDKVTSTSLMEQKYGLLMLTLQTRYFVWLGLIIQVKIKKELHF